MRRIPEKLIDEVRNRSDIVETISQYLPLTKKGKNYWGLCPFHDDSNPSMSVSPERQIFKCFVCGTGGNVFSFIEKYEDISFVDSVIKQAQNINVDLGEYANVTTTPKNPRKEKLHELMQEVQNFCSYQLHSKEGRKAVQILKERGYPDGVIKKFGIGVALDGNKIHQFLNAKGYEDDEMLSVDLIRISERGVQDVFYNRLMFPIHDQFNNVIAFTARTIDANNNVKYINTSETEIYTKGDHIYNLNRIKSNRKTVDYLVITEGVTDVFAFDMAGVESTVSILGVALTDQQLRLIQSTTQHVILAFDGDQAGFEATYKIGHKLVKNRLKVSVWYNDSELDPDDLYRLKGSKPLVDGIESALSWYDFVIAYAKVQYGLESFENRKRVVNFVLPYLEMADSLTKDYYLNKLAEMTGFSKDSMGGQITNVQSQQQHRVPISVPQTSIFTLTNNVSRAELEILKQMILSKEAAYIYRDELGFLPDDLAFELSLLLIDLYRTRDKIEIADLLSVNLSDKMHQFVLELEERLTVDVYDKDIVLDNIEHIKRKMEQLSSTEIKEKILNADELDKQVSLLEDIISNKRKQ